MEQIDTTGWTRWEYINFYAKIWDVSVIPVDENKRPMVAGWTPYQTAMPTEEELDRWFNKWKAWGLAIICQHRLFSPDLDTPKVYEMLKEKGAFPEGTCIFKSAKGYHAILRSKDIVPYSVKEHSDELTAINPLLYEFGISGNNGLAIVPDTPEREWLELYDEPVEVNYEEWLEKYIGWSKRSAGESRSNGWLPLILCPWHENDGLPHEPSLHINILDGGFYCHGCDKTGKLTELIEYCKSIDYKLPDEVYDYQPPRPRETEIIEVKTGRQSLEEPMEEIPEFVNNWVRRGDLSLLVGFGGVGKSTIQMHLGLSYAGGVDFIGYQVAEAGKVLCLDLEMGEPEFRERLNTILPQYPDLALDNFYFACLSNLSMRYDCNKQRLRRTLEAIRPQLLIIDNHASFHGGDPNRENEMMDNVILPFREYMADFGIAILYLIHTPWGDRERPRGSAAIFDAAATVVVVTKPRENIRHLEWSKRRAVRRGMGAMKLELSYDEETYRIYRTATDIEDMLRGITFPVKRSVIAKRFQVDFGLSHSQSFKRVAQLIDRRLLTEEGGLIDRTREDKARAILTGKKVDEMKDLGLSP